MIVARSFSLYLAIAAIVVAVAQAEDNVDSNRESQNPITNTEFVRSDLAELSKVRFETRKSDPAKRCSRFVSKLRQIFARLQGEQAASQVISNAPEQQILAEAIRALETRRLPFNNQQPVLTVLIECLNNPNKNNNDATGANNAVAGDSSPTARSANERVVIAKPPTQAGDQRPASGQQPMRRAMEDFAQVKGRQNDQGQDIYQKKRQNGDGSKKQAEQTKQSPSRDGLGQYAEEVLGDVVENEFNQATGGVFDPNANYAGPLGSDPNQTPIGQLENEFQNPAALAEDVIDQFEGAGPTMSRSLDSPAVAEPYPAHDERGIHTAYPASFESLADAQLEEMYEREHDQVRRLELMLERERRQNRRLRTQLDDNAYEIESLKNRLVDGAGAVKIGKYLEHRLNHVSHNPAAIMRALDRRLAPRKNTLAQKCQKYYMLLSYPGKVDDSLIKHIAKLNVPLSVPVQTPGELAYGPEGYPHRRRPHRRHGRDGFFEGEYDDEFGYDEFGRRRNRNHVLRKRSLEDEYEYEYGARPHYNRHGRRHDHGLFEHHRYYADDYSSKLHHYADMIAHHETAAEMGHVIESLRECAALASPRHHGYNTYEGADYYDEPVGGLNRFGRPAVDGVSAASAAAAVSGNEAHMAQHVFGQEPVHSVHRLAPGESVTSTSFDAPPFEVPSFQRPFRPSVRDRFRFPQRNHHSGPASASASASAGAGGAAAASASAASGASNAARLRHADTLSSHFPSMPPMPSM